MKTEVVYVRLPEGLKAELTEIARLEQRSLSAQVTYFLKIAALDYFYPRQKP